jgi:hypothetical protein
MFFQQFLAEFDDFLMQNIIFYSEFKDYVILVDEHLNP